MTAVIESLERDRGRGELGQFCRGVCSRVSMGPLVLGTETRKDLVSHMVVNLCQWGIDR